MSLKSVQPSKWQMPKPQESGWPIRSRYATILLTARISYVTPIPTYLPTYLPTYIHTYIHTYLATYIHTYIHTYLHTYIHTYIHTYLLPTYLPTYLHTYIPTYMHTYLHAYLPTYIIHTYIHTYIPTYIHTYHTQEGNTKTWKLTNEQTRPNNQTFEIIFEIHKFNRIWQTITETV